MLVEVAGRAGGPEAQVGPGEIDARGGELVLLLIEPRLVTGLARQRRVLAGESVAGLLVVEGLAALLSPPHEVVLETLVLDVAGLAVAVGRSRVKPASKACW